MAKDLMQLGMPDQAATRLGFQYAAVAATGSAASDAAVLLKSQTMVSTTGAASTGLKLPSDAEIGQPIFIANLDANAKLIYPPTDGQINGDTATTGTVPLTARGSCIVWRIDTTNWASVGGAAG